MQRTLGPVERAIVKADQLKRGTCNECREAGKFLTLRGGCYDCFGARLARLQERKRAAGTTR